MPQVGETTGFAPEAHLAALLAHCPDLDVSWVLAQHPDAPWLAEREVRAFGALGAQVFHADLTAEGAPGRHDVGKLAAALKELL